MVINIAYLLAAAIAIRLGSISCSGSKWLPDQEAVPLSRTAIVTVIVAAFLGMMYVSVRQRWGFTLLVGLTFLFTCCAAFGLFQMHNLIKRYGYFVETTPWLGKSRIMTTKVGGDTLSAEARNITKIR